MRDGAALANAGTGFDPRAALLSLAGHGLAFGVAAAFAIAASSPDPSPTYAVIFEAPPPAPLQVAAVLQATQVAASEPEPEFTPPAPDLPVPEMAAPEIPAEPMPVAEAAPLPPPKASRPRPAPRPARIVEQPAPVARKIAPAPVEASVAEPIETAIEAPAQVAYAPLVPVAPAPVAAAPAAIPVITEARFRERPSPPAYPRRAAELGQRGTAVLRALVQADGSTAEIVIWRSSGITSLDEAALGAVRAWRFEPARRDGDAIVAWVEIPVRFELN